MKTLRKLFGGLNITWPKLIIFSIIMGIYTALMAMLVPDGNSFHDIAATLEWWILFAVIIIVNSKKPLEAALKTFVFFLISQPLVYLIQVPFSFMGWGLFQFYPYWFMITLATFPGAFIGWYIKKDKWYSGVILSVMTSLLVITGVSYVRSCIETPFNHLISAIYCFAIIPIFIFTIFKNKIPRIITGAISLIVLFICIPLSGAVPYDAYNNTFIEENDIVLVGEPEVSSPAADGEGHVELIKYDGGMNFKLSGIIGKRYPFTVTDDEKIYYFEYYYNGDHQTVMIDYIKSEDKSER